MLSSVIIKNNWSLNAGIYFQESDNNKKNEKKSTDTIFTFSQ